MKGALTRERLVGHFSVGFLLSFMSSFVLSLVDLLFVRSFSHSFLHSVVRCSLVRWFVAFVGSYVR